MRVIESFDATPNTNLLDVLANSGYSLPAAIADIIDNSIAAKSKNIFVNMIFKDTNSSITIIDDGIGMSLEKLKQASIIAFRNIFEHRQEDDLGRFSTGINSSSASMCTHLIIQSKSNRDDKYNTVSINYFDMKEEKKWKCDVIEMEDRYVESVTGTAIVWQNLKEISSAKSPNEFYAKIARVERHLSHVFNDYISNGVNIYINNNRLNGWDPFYQTNIKTTKIYDEIHEYHSSKIKVKIYILPPYNNLSQDEQAYMKGNGLSEQQGFYIYRNNRLIKEGGWLGIDDLSISNKYDYARIRVDISTALDPYFKPNFLKNEIHIPDDLVDFFKKIALNARNESRKNYNYMKAPYIIRGVKKNNQNPVWNSRNSSDGILLSINEDHPIIKSLCSDMSEVKRKRLFKLISTNIPIGEITRSGLSQKQTRYPNIEAEMNEMYEQLLTDGLTSKEIMQRMITCEPFCLSDDLISDLIDFFSNKGVI